VTKPKVVFDPYSEDYFNNPFDIYRRMREDAPLYYDEKEDFYALTRHEDVAAAFKDFETYSSARGCDLAMVRRGISPEQKSIIFMDPPEHRHMRSLLNKAFTPRAIQSQRETVIEVIDKYLGAADPDQFDVVQDFSGPFPVEVITRMAGVPEEYRQQVRHWIDTSLHHEPGQIEISEAGMQANIDTAMYYFGLVQQRREAPQDDMISRLTEAEVTEDGETRRLDDIEITGFCTMLGGAGAETVTKLVGNAVVVFADNPDQWQKLQEDRSKIPAAFEELLRYEGPSQYQIRTTTRDVTLHDKTIPEGDPVLLINGSASRDERFFPDADRFDIDRERKVGYNLNFGYGIHSCLGAALARMESRIALERLLDFMPRYEVDWAGCKRVNMQNVAGWKSVPVKVLR
jgi:cytochrome P450